MPIDYNAMAGILSPISGPSPPTPQQNAFGSLFGLSFPSPNSLARTYMAQNALPPNQPPILPIPQNLLDAYAAASKKNGGYVVYDQPEYQNLMNSVNSFLLKNKMRPGDNFIINHPGTAGTTLYEVLPSDDGSPAFRPVRKVEDTPMS